MDHDRTALAILEGVGGEENISSVVHCATRLRFVLKNNEVADIETIRAIPGVVTTAQAGSQFQVVVGNEVPEVHAALTGSMMNAHAPADDAPVEHQNLMGRFISMISGIFTPLLWALAASGLIKAFLQLAAYFGWIAEDGTNFTVLYAISDAILFFLPIALAVTAARHFKANEFTALTIGAALCYPALVALAPPPGAEPTSYRFAGLPMTMAAAYTGSVIPIILAVWLQSKLEKPLYKHIWAPIRRFLTPMIVLLVIVPLVLLVVGPISTIISNGMAAGINWLFDRAGWLGGLIMGGIWQVLVIFGLHWGMVPLFIQDMGRQGYTLLGAPIFAAVFAQAAACLAVLIKSRNHARRQAAVPATISGFVAGVTEPAIYGVNLPLKIPFIAGVVGGAIGGAIISAGRVVSINPAPPSGIGFVPSLLPGTADYGGSFIWAVIGVLVAIAIAFLGTLFFLREHDESVEVASEIRQERKAEHDERKAEHYERKAEHHELKAERDGAPIGSLGSLGSLGALGALGAEPLVEPVVVATGPAEGALIGSVLHEQPEIPEGADAAIVGYDEEVSIFNRKKPAPVASVPVAPVAAVPVAPAASGARVLAPLTGQVIPLSEVPDPVFSGGMMGNGYAIIPTEGRLVAPFDGEVAAIFPTGHAVGLRDASGAEVLMHIGIDTVALNGKHFKAHVVQGQHVKAGDTLVEFDIPAIKAEGYSVATPVIVTNADDGFGTINRVAGPGVISAGQPLYNVSA